MLSNLQNQCRILDMLLLGFISPNNFLYKGGRIICTSFHYMIHSFRNLDLNSLNITLNNNRLENLTQAKYLGVILDPHLKYKYHIEYIAKKISKSIGILFKLKKLKTPSSILKQIYYSLIYSLLNYNICSYAGTYDVHLNRLFLLQKRAVRLICNEFIFSSY